LQRLTGLEHQKIHDELEEIAANIKEYNEILSSRTKLMDLIKTEMIAIKDEFATPRLTAIEASEYEQDIEDLIQREDMVITVTIGGYIKRVPLSTYRAQRRGGKGRSAMSTHAEDITTKVFVANTHTDMLFFSSRGKVYKLKVYRLPLGNPQSKGRALVNLLPLAENEVINNILSIPEDRENINDYNIIFATKSGNIRRNAIDEFLHIQSNGKIAMKL
jgi:DNA gyrase subunit A